MFRTALKLARHRDLIASDDLSLSKRRRAFADELREVVGRLRGHDEIRLMVGRMDNKFWQLLTDIGKKLGEHVDIRVDKAFLFNLFQNSIGGNSALLGAGPRVRMRPDGSVFIEDANLDELYTIGNTFLNFGRGMIGVRVLIAHPDKVLQDCGRWSGRVMIDLALHGSPSPCSGSTCARAWSNASQRPANAGRGRADPRDALGRRRPRLVTDIVIA
jgi:hypothetical protein